MPEPQMTSLVLMIWRHVAQGNLKTHPHPWSSRHHTDVLVSLTLHNRGTVHSTVLHVLYVAEQGTAHNIASKKSVSLSPNTHTCLSSSYPDATIEIYQLFFKSSTYCHPGGISSSWESRLLVHRSLKQYMRIEETLLKEKECDCISIYISIICFLHGYVFRSGLLRSQSWYPDISAATSGSMTSWRNIIWSPIPTVCLKTTSNHERGVEFLNEENSVYQKFKSIATSTAGNCTLYILKWKALLVPLQPLKEITPHYSYHVLEPHPSCMHRTGKWCPKTLQLASLPIDTVLTALPSTPFEAWGPREK